MILTDEQQKVCNMLITKGYIITRNSLWPIYENPQTGTRIQVATDGRQIEAGYTVPTEQWQK